MSARQRETYVLRDDKCVLHQLDPGRQRADVVEAVSGLQTLVGRVVHHGRRQRVVTDKVSQATRRLQGVRQTAVVHWTTTRGTRNTAVVLSTATRGTRNTAVVLSTATRGSSDAGTTSHTAPVSRS